MDVLGLVAIEFKARRSNYDCGYGTSGLMLEATLWEQYESCDCTPTKQARTADKLATFEKKVFFVLSTVRCYSYGYTNVMSEPVTDHW